MTLLGDASGVMAHQIHKDSWTSRLNSMKLIEEILIVSGII